MALRKFDDIKVKEEEKKLTKEEKKEIKRKQREERKELRKEKKNLPKIEKSVQDKMEIRDVTDDDFMKTKNGFLNIYQIKGKDVDGGSDLEQETIIKNFMRFLRIYVYDLKLIMMNFPINTSEQQEYILNKIKNTENELYKKLLYEKLEELVELEKEKTNIEYYIMNFIDKNEHSSEKLRTLMRSRNRDCNLMPMTLEKKLRILYKLNNLNTKLM
ncbi:hypothetical protein K5V21_12640 [Clostridium sardiniense]|uniref:Uncharacterized protein n=1 Tax=Clostridium sardiniense TaxID=29369 RepID=A0ABS7KZQ4_CLOSR|nr:hypothetical protein [Clostridium sardiniense]MBY0756295.1 hypothetical protein [Clostridium sardiniense]MDQ0461449.1 hypothetical protein [Clostridium sardiniense]